MLIEERHRRILEALQENPQITVKELAGRLCFSEPTIRRDFTELHKKGLITKFYGGAILNKRAADGEIPFSMRENEKSTGKALIGKRGSSCARRSGHNAGWIYQYISFGALSCRF